MFTSHGTIIMYLITVTRFLIFITPFVSSNSSYKSQEIPKIPEIMKNGQNCRMK
jgi:hypothetical protein